MPTCHVCRQDNPTGARFCNACGSPLDGEARPLREERKVVTVLFADLVGFTARSERMDPEACSGSCSRTTPSCAQSSSGTAARSRSSWATR
jgi:hypothetical protein